MSEGFFRVLSWLGYSFLSWAGWSTAPVVQTPSLPGSCAVSTLGLSPRAHSSDTSMLCASLGVAGKGVASSLHSRHTCSSDWAGKAGLCKSFFLSVHTRAISLGLPLQPADPHPLHCSSHLGPTRACTQLWGDSIKGRRCSCYRCEVGKSQNRIRDVWVVFFIPTTVQSCGSVLWNNWCCCMKRAFAQRDSLEQEFASNVTYCIFFDHCYWLF